MAGGLLQGAVVAVSGGLGALAERGGRLLEFAYEGAGRCKGLLDDIGDGRVQREGRLLPQQPDATGGLNRTAVGMLDIGSDPQQGGLARAVLSDQGEAFPLVDRQVDVRQDATVRIGLADPIKGRALTAIKRVR